MADFNFTTGPATLPAVGELFYNGCEFSPLFSTELSGTAVKDNAQRTVKLMEYELVVDGYVTLAAGNDDINPTMVTLRNLLTGQGGYLRYTGRGFNLVVNPPGGARLGAGPAEATTDVAWGPIPELLEFQPLGGRSAKIVWKVTVRVLEMKGQGPLLQFNTETGVTYAEDFFSGLSIKGTIEIPLTRLNQANRRLATTVDDFRTQLDIRIFSDIDLTRFRPVRRSYSVSRDKRSLEFDIELEEKPYMDLPPGSPIARGTYSVRPVRAGMGLALWMCTLRATYTVRMDFPRRDAWQSFLLLLRKRMGYSRFANIPQNANNQNPGIGPLLLQAGGAAANALPGGRPAGAAADLLARLWRAQHQAANAGQRESRRAFLIDFSIDEGLYLDSKTVSFSASWRLVTTFSHILLASGLWRKVPERWANGENIWAITMRDVSGSRTWMQNGLDPAADIIVDFGGG